MDRTCKRSKCQSYISDLHKEKELIHCFFLCLHLYECASVGGCCLRKGNAEVSRLCQGIVRGWLVSEASLPSMKLTLT